MQFVVVAVIYEHIFCCFIRFLSFISFSNICWHITHNNRNYPPPVVSKFQPQPFNSPKLFFDITTGKNPSRESWPSACMPHTVCEGWLSLIWFLWLVTSLLPRLYASESTDSIVKGSSQISSNFPFSSGFECIFYSRACFVDLVYVCVNGCFCGEWIGDTVFLSEDEFICDEPRGGVNDFVFSKMVK